MSDAPVTHEHIEEAFKPAAEILSKLPDSTLTREAKRNLDITEDLAHKSRERVYIDGQD